MQKLSFLIVAVILLAFMPSCSKTDSSSCTTATGLTTLSVTSATANLKWDNVTNEVSYQIQYRKVGDQVWISTATFSNTLQLTALNPNTNYEWQVKTVCSLNVSEYSSSATFKTAACPTGYEGTNCDIAMNQKFAGTYNVTDTATDNVSGTQSFTYTFSITASTSNPAAISVTGLTDPGTSLNGTVDGSNFTVQDYTTADGSFTNFKGTVSGKQLRFTYDYNLPSANAVGSAHATGIKQ